ncbi:MAG TPA: hypothetical protein VJ063_17245 [Verrucomicrobiae bacterium]|nr:hypothetical protein [Verrucomicrobiae bacterium]
MILLRPDCLVFKTSSGENIPCSAQEVTLELLGDAVSQIDQLTVQNAAQAVLHYFRHDLERTVVTIGEFAETLAKVLRSLGLEVSTSGDYVAARRVVDSDLRPLAIGYDGVCELVFFQMLRAELRNHLEAEPQVLRFNGLRSCVKQMVGARRWTYRCQQLSDQIVSYLRDCFTAEAGGSACALVVR